LAGALALLGCGAALAQDTNPVSTSANAERSGTVVVPERPTAYDDNTTPNTGILPTPLGNRDQLPAEVTSRIERFKADARRYLAQQELLKKKLAGANDQERAAIREQLRLLREKWLERSREMREQYKDRKAELESKLRDHRELFDDIRGAAAEKRREAGDRPRRGID
jgi:hypothetical protein